MYAETEADGKPNDGGEDSWETLPIFAYEEIPPIVKTREEIVAEKLAALRRFQYEPEEAPENDGSGASVYLDVCRRIHKATYMKFPTTSIANDLRAERETLDFSHARLGTKGAVALAAALRVNAAATSLVLTGNAITPSAGLEIVRAVNESRFITSLDFSVNALGKTELLSSRSGAGVPVRGGAVINELLGLGSVISHLSLRGNHLTDSDVALFADTLSENVNLLSLDLSDNKLGPSAAATLAGVLSRNSDLRTINLEWNQLGSTACRMLLADGFLQNNTIKSFNLSACGLDDASAQLIARIISENATEEITIANNRLSSTGAEVIAKALLPDSSLTSLVMDGNNIGDSGCRALVAAAAACLGLGDEAAASGFAAAASSSGKTFRLLSLQHCGCSAEMEEKYSASCCAENTSGRRCEQTYSGLRISEGFGNMVLF